MKSHLLTALALSLAVFCSPLPLNAATGPGLSLDAGSMTLPDALSAVRVSGANATAGADTDGDGVDDDQDNCPAIANTDQLDTDSDDEGDACDLDDDNDGDPDVTDQAPLDPAVFTAARWATLGAGMNNEVNALVLDGSGNLVAGGAFTQADGSTANGIASWNGSAWSPLGAGMNGAVNAVVIDRNGTVYAGGNFTTAAGTVVNYVAKWDGSSWQALGSGMNAAVNALAVDSAGNLYAGGDFDEADGKPVNYVARWNGSSWSAMGVGMTSVVSALLVDGNNNVYVGGWFVGAGAYGIAKWTGTAWSPIGLGMDSPVSALVMDGAGNLYVGGYFTMAGGGVAANYIARWNGSAWSTLGSGLSDPVNALVLDAQGNLYAGGFFSQAGTAGASHIARWNGSRWDTLGAGVDNTVNALAINNGNGHVYAGGSFQSAGNRPAAYVAAWLVDADSDGVPDSTDNCPALPNTDQLNADGDTAGNACDTDDDNDGVADTADAFPLDPAETADADVDGIGDNADRDDDNDGVDDLSDAFPLDPAESVDTDLDGKGDNADQDDDNDGVQDQNDAFPLDAGESVDTDGDGTGNNADSDDDNDNLPDAIDPFPTNAEVIDQASGSYTRESAGQSVAFAGDFDGDGYGDYVIGSPSFDVGALLNVGRVRVVSGSTGKLLWERNGENPGEKLGYAVAGGADINQDGYDDVLIGAPGAEKVGLVLGRGNGQAARVAGLLADDDGTFSWLEPAYCEQQFGMAVALGDVDGDGVADIVVGSPKTNHWYLAYNEIGEEYAAKIIGTGSVSVYNSALAPVSIAFGNDQSKARFGRSLALGDLDGNETLDIVAGAPGDADGQGCVVGYNALDRSVLVQACGNTRNGRFGYAVAAGDVDGDGNADVLVGAPNEGSEALKKAGSIRVLGGEGSFMQVTGNAGARLGSSVALGDVNGDGYDDIIAGAWKDDDEEDAGGAGKDAGSLSIWSGATAELITTLYGESGSDHFGTALGVGDVNRDGKADIIVGIPGFDAPGGGGLLGNAGAVQVLSGAELSGGVPPADRRSGKKQR